MKTKNKPEEKNKNYYFIADEPKPLFNLAYAVKFWRHNKIKDCDVKSGSFNLPLYFAYLENNLK